MIIGWRNSGQLQEPNKYFTRLHTARLQSAKPCLNLVYNTAPVEQRYSDNRRTTVMGDTFSNIQNSTIVNRSLVENAFNKAKSEVDSDAAAMLLKVAEFVDQSGNKEA